MLVDTLARDLFSALVAVPIVDSHSHIDPLAPTARSFDDLLGYHYYTELAHSAGMGHESLAPEFDPRERCRAILGFINRFDNTAQYGWLLEIARTFLNFDGDRIRVEDTDSLFDAANTKLNAQNWTATVIERTNLERVFLTNAFDDCLDGFDREFFVPCLRTDDLVFRWHDPGVRTRLRSVTGIEPASFPAVRRCLQSIFERFVNAGTRACAISLPPSFQPRESIGSRPDGDAELDRAMQDGNAIVGEKIFWMLAECCRDFGLPFDLMIGVNRLTYRGGVFQGQDLFDQRTSLLQFADVFNAFPKVNFCVSVLSSGQNQELVSHAWIFPNVFPHGHWWYSNVPTYIEYDLRARLQAVPKVKLLGYYSDAYKLEFVLPKFNMYRSILANVLADDYVRTRRLNESDAVELGIALLRGNAERVFRLK